MAESNPKKESAPVRPESVEKFMNAFKKMGMDEHGQIHKENARKYYQMTVGKIYDDELAKVLVDHMKADENGMIDEEGIMAPFTLDHWPRDVLTGVCDLLEKSPDLQKKYIKTLAKVLNLTEEEIEQLSCHSCKSAADYIREMLEKTPEKSQEAGKSDLMDTFKDKCHLLGNCGCEDEAGSSEDPSQPEMKLGPQEESQLAPKPAPKDDVQKK